MVDPIRLMDSLTGPERDLLSAFDLSLEPPASARDAVWNGISVSPSTTQVSNAPCPLSAMAQGTLAPKFVASTSWVALGIKCCVVVALVVGAWSTVSMARSRWEAEGEGPVSKDGSAHRHPMVGPSRVLSYAVRAPFTPDERRTVYALPKPKGLPLLARHEPPTKPVVEADAASQEHASTMAEEARLLLAAKRAASGGRLLDALASLADSDRRFPMGALGEERTVLRLEVECAASGSPQAILRYVASHPDSAFRIRLEQIAARTH